MAFVRYMLMKQQVESSIPPLNENPDGKNPQIIQFLSARHKITSLSALPNMGSTS
jgi:hypothetical protein